MSDTSAWVLRLTMRADQDWLSELAFMAREISTWSRKVWTIVKERPGLPCSVKFNNINGVSYLDPPFAYFHDKVLHEYYIIL